MGDLSPIFGHYESGVEQALELAHAASAVSRGTVALGSRRRDLVSRAGAESVFEERGSQAGLLPVGASLVRERPD